MARRRSLRASLALSLLAAGCGGGPTWDGTTYRDDEARFQVAGPGEGWTPIRLERETDLAFHHAGHDAVLQVHASCDPALDIPLSALTNQILAGFTERAFLEQDVVPFDGREAMRTRVDAKLDGVPRSLALVVAKKDGCVYDLVLVAPPGPDFTAARPTWERAVETFHAPPRGEVAR